MIRFSAHCARDHDRVDFTDPTAFEAHMLETHGRKPLVPGGRVPSWRYNETTRKGAPGMAGGRILEPWPWKAPKAPADATDLARVLSQYAGETYGTADVETDDAIPDGLWRFDREHDGPVPAHALPANVRPILEGAMARGEMWLLSVDGPRVRLEVGRKQLVNAAPVTVAGKIELLAGKVRKVLTVDPSRDDYDRWQDGRITDVKRAFPAPGVEVGPAA